MSSDLTFAVCAYKDSPYLEEAVRSAVRQSSPVELLIATSTPSDHIRKIAEKYQARYCVNPEKKGIAADWNFALSCARTPYATIVHQDDVYLPEYARKVREQLRRHPDALIAFTDYGDLMADGEIHSGRYYLFFKRLLLWAFFLKHVHSSGAGKRSAVVFGDAICCPSVTYNLNQLKDTRFRGEFSVNLDWDMWLRLSEQAGSFVFIPQVLMGHRIADAMETAAAIADHRREREDIAIFERIWGKKFAAAIMRFYRYSYRANNGRNGK